MPGCSINQARRRSASDVVESINQTTHVNPDDATVTVGFGEVKYTLVVPPLAMKTSVSRLNPEA